MHEAKSIVRSQRLAEEADAAAIRRAVESVPAVDERIIKQNGREIKARLVSLPDNSKAIREAFFCHASCKGKLRLSQRSDYTNLPIVEFISLGANVYGEEYSEIIWRDQETREEFVVWTNVNLFYMHSFQILDVGDYQYHYFGFITAFSRESERIRIEMAKAHGFEAQSRWKEPPVNFSDDSYEYVVVADDVAQVPEKLYRQLDALLSEYLSRKTEWEISYKNARTLEAARQQDLKENPPTPEDSVTNFWPGENSVYLKKNE